uniref:Uncharacterized protein n=1 Tax=viral metagenome TaxID=1070528 RepID=A0A6M3M131_9ZZZZ
MLVKISLGNVRILNREALIKRLQEGNDSISLILKPFWYAEYATVAHMWSVPGWTEEELNANAPTEYYSVFLKSNGEFSIDLEMSDVKEDEDEEDLEE